MTYSPIDGKSADQLYAELRTVYSNYPEYNDPDLGSGDFYTMVEKFASDPFYNLHLVAKEYIRLVDRIFK